MTGYRYLPLKELVDMKDSPERFATELDRAVNDCLDTLIETYVPKSVQEGQKKDNIITRTSSYLGRTRDKIVDALEARSDKLAKSKVFDYAKTFLGYYNKADEAVVKEIYEGIENLRGINKHLDSQLEGKTFLGNGRDAIAKVYLRYGYGFLEGINLFSTLAKKIHSDTFMAGDLKELHRNLNYLMVLAVERYDVENAFDINQELKKIKEKKARAIETFVEVLIDGLSKLGFPDIDSYTANNNQDMQVMVELEQHIREQDMVAAVEHDLREQGILDLLESSDDSNNAQ
jgi:hypothetical protein